MMQFLYVKLANILYLRGIWWAGLGGRMMVRRGFVMVKDRGVRQVHRGVARRLRVALR